MCVYVYVYIDELNALQYTYFDGCNNGGNHCLQGRTCDRKDPMPNPNITDFSCTNCSFKECKQRAKIEKSYAFAYLGIGQRKCKLCDLTTLLNRRNVSFAWGIYVKSYDVEGKYTLEKW